ncbi:MAG: hypothetical protein ACRBFS_11630 [Aureispira sp.]
MKNAFFLLLLLTISLLSACSGEPVAAPVVVIEEEPLQGEITLEDTLRLKEGRLPENWELVDLPEGYYIGFPKTPKRRSSKSQKRIDYLLKRNKYRFQSSVTDLSNLASFQENKAYRIAYYEAIVEDLAEDVNAAIVEQDLFYSQGVYEGSRALLKTEEAQVYLQCVIIDALLFTSSLTVYDEETPAYLQLRDRFFYSFGNRDYTDPTSITTE